MATSQIPLIIKKFATFRQVFQLKNSDSEPIDLAGCNVKSKASESYQKKAEIDMNPAITDAAGGKFSLSLSAEQTGALGFSAGKYDVLIEFPDPEIGTVRAVEGLITVQEGVTE